MKHHFYMVLRWIAFPFVQLLRFLDEHAVGILATLLVHLFVITLVLIAKINTMREHQGVLTQIEFEKEQSEPKPKPKPDQQATPQMTAAGRAGQADMMRSIPVNEVEAQAVQNIGKMVKDIQRELNVQDVQPLGEAQTSSPSDPRPAAPTSEAKVYDDKFPLNARGERIVYRGPTTVSYRLDKRQHLYMPIPAYKCQGGGTVVVDISVNRRGYVVQSAIRKELMADLDPCFADAAQRAAETARFTADPAAAEPQSGSITYIFIPQ